MPPPASQLPETASAMQSAGSPQAGARHDDGTGLVRLDPWLEPYSQHLRNRYLHFLHFRSILEQHGGALGEMTTGHQYFGFNRGTHEGKSGVWYREWAPGAKSLKLIGDFNGWAREGRCGKGRVVGVVLLLLHD